nr:DUF4375 domain-containing protein [uncultured Rhodoferax sp.]
MNQQLLDRAIAYSIACVEAASGDVFKLPLPVQTVAVVQTAQGIIDNGGFEYFYESDFDGTPPYSFFVETFRRIGAEAAAQRLEASSRLFPFSEPHLHEEKRQRWLDTVKEDETHEFVVLSKKACGDESVFAKLADYVERNRDAFAAA